MNKEEIVRRLEELNVLSCELDTAEAQRLEMSASVVGYANSFIKGLDKVKTFGAREANSLEINNKKRPLKELLNLYQKEVVETGINAASGGHLLLKMRLLIGSNLSSCFHLVRLAVCLLAAQYLLLLHLLLQEIDTRLRMSLFVRVLSI